MERMMFFVWRSNETVEEVENRYIKEYSEFCNGHIPAHGRDLPWPVKTEIVDGKEIEVHEFYIYRTFYD